MEAGFIGLGGMGRAMAANLMKAGHRVRVWNRSRAPMDELARKGAEPVEEARLAFGGVVISMLADDEAVREVILGSAARRGRAARHGPREHGDDLGRASRSS